MYMKPKQFFLRFVLSLALFAAGLSSAFAGWEYEKEGEEGGGGGSYTFRNEKRYFTYDGKNYDSNHLDWFLTRKRFDGEKDQFYYEFEMRVCCDMIIDFDKSTWNMIWYKSEVQQTLIEGEVFVVTADDVLHSLGTWKKNKTDKSTISFTNDKTQEYGGFHTYNMDTDNGHVKVRFLPRRQAFIDGVKKIIFKNRLVFQDSREWGWFQYEKDIDLDYFDDHRPMPQLTADWNANGSLSLAGTDLRDISKDNRYMEQKYRVYQYLYPGYKDFYYDDFKLDESSVNIEHKADKKMDVAFSKWYLSGGAYTTPVWVRYRGESKVNTEDAECYFSGVWYYQPYVMQLIKPYTRPENLRSDFDKWAMTNTIRWSRRYRASGYDGTTVSDVECRTDGKWYLIRYDKGKNPQADGYKLLATIDGSSLNSSLCYTDKDIEYDRQYVYRVIFLPALLEADFKDRLADLPGQAPSHSSSDLWEEQTVSTLMEVPIRLSQDRTFERAVRLVWDYNIQLKDLAWRIERRTPGSIVWKPVDDPIPVDASQSQEHFDVEGTVCDVLEYRVLTTVNGKELTSNILAANLPAGSYISEVTATTGTEETSVIVKWKVARVDVTHEASYRVLRRLIGAEEWTLLADDIHGTESEYQYTDTRVAAGSYYEYTVEAYDAMCDDQFVRTDSQITPGFSQARGTITGHVAFGSGTAVRDVRVNLVKSSSDVVTDQPQYLSRFIEGDGKGIAWTADSAKYASVLNGQKELTLQLWAKPTMESGLSKQSFLHLTNALELGVKRISDDSNYTVVAEEKNGFDAEGRIILASAADWERFAERVRNGDTSLSAVMIADIDLEESQTMVGEEGRKRYSGHFYGNGHTLTVHYYVHSSEDGSDSYRTAPFAYVSSCTIEDLHVAGTISTNAQFAGGIIGDCEDYCKVNLYRCWSSVTIESRCGGEGNHGGLIARSGGMLIVNSCLFDGVIKGEGLKNCGGFVGLQLERRTAEIAQCLMNPASVPVTSGCATFVRCSSSAFLNINRSFYTKAMGEVQGEYISSRAVKPSLLGADWMNSNDRVVPRVVESPVNYRKTTFRIASTVHPATSDTIDRNAYCLYAVDLTPGEPTQYRVTEFQNLPFHTLDFTHVTARYQQGQWIFSVGRDTLLSDTIAVASTAWNSCSSQGTVTLSLGGSLHATGSSFKGNVDDVRLWNRALSQKEFNSNFDRILGGTDEGLMLYWPFDEGINLVHYVFDVANQDGIYQLNHPEVGVNAVPSPLVPDHLRLYGMTDSEGDYIIRGIPFQQGGTNYKVVPQLGVHEFSPNSSSMFISPTSLTANNVNFEDVSAFPMEGYIYYAGTNIPAEGIMFYVDGDLQSKDGQAVKTDADGFYNLSVPIGKHYVEAKLDGHRLAYGGRFPHQGTFNFDREVIHDFADSTLVNFVGRVGGGERNDTLAVGFGASKNNIGIATITLKLNNESFSFNCQDDHITSATQNRPFASDTTSINSHSWAGTGPYSKYIYIRTDSLTGEFSAMLPPLKYITKSINIDKNSNIEFSSLPEIDLTNPNKAVVDSLKQYQNGDSICLTYTYNTKLIKTYFSEPKLNIVEKGNDPGAFGMREVVYKDDQGGPDLIIGDLWTRQKDGSIQYLVDYPIYQTGDVRYFDLRAYEAYANYDGKVVVADTIPLRGVTLTVTNEMSSAQKVICTVEDPESPYKPGDLYDLVNESFELDANGEGSLSWTVGAPNIVKPYTRLFSTSLERNGRTYVVANFNAVVLGALTTGNNFITKGPDLVQFILRDPPGGKSKTTLKRGRVTTRTHYDTYRAYGTHSLVNNLIMGSHLELGSGIGFFVITGNKVTNQLDLGVASQWEWNHVKDTVVIETEMSSVSTATTSPYVGARGDVFVGTSTNMLLGLCRNLFIKHDTLTHKYSIELEDAMSIGQEIATAFKYTTYEIETVMIPKWKDMRKQYLSPIGSKEEAEDYVNTGQKSVYLTWLPENDPKYGEDETYVYVAPANPIENEIDSVKWCNEQIKRWIYELSLNEEEKVEVMKKSTPENFSIDGGTTYTFSSRHEVSKTDEKKTTWRIGGVFGEHFGWKLWSAATFGIITNITTEAGRGAVEGDGTKESNYTEWEYTVQDGNRDTDISINQYKPDNQNNSYIFSIFGGQTYNPYEGQDTTKWYQPGTPLGNATLQMEQPDLQISLDGQHPAKSATLTDIPAGGEAHVVLHCTNLATAHQGINFSYNLIILENTNVDGLQILMDGVPINGRSIYLNHNETVTKVLTIRQTDQSILNYDGIKIRFCSQYQPAIINSDVTLNARFKPSSSPVNLVIDEPVLNIETGNSLAMKVTDFDRSFKSLKFVGVQYRFAGNTGWTPLYQYLVNPADTAKYDYPVLPTSGDLPLSLDMQSEASYPQGTYTFRAFTAADFDNQDVYVYSDEVTVIKDNIAPRPLTTPTPSSGILGFGDDMSIEFTEDIVPGYVGDKNVIVTAVLNDRPIDHEVSYQLVPRAPAGRTRNPIFLSGDFSLDFWLKWDQAGTILRHGKGQNAFALSLDADGHVHAIIGGTDHVSTKTLPAGPWTFMALSYKSSEKTFSMLAQYGTTNVDLFMNEPVSDTGTQVIQYADDNYLYISCDLLGGAMHDLSLFNIYRDVNDAAATRYQSKTAYTYGLTNYWPMNEGHGYVIADARHTHDFDVVNTWLIDNRNYAVRFLTSEGMTADISRLATGIGDSYAIEMWAYPEKITEGATLFETGTNPYNRLRLYYDADKNLWLEYGEKKQMVADDNELSTLDFEGGWSHIALNVVRGQSASFYFNGHRTTVISETDMPQVEGPVMKFGEGYTGYLDEVRYWRATLSEGRLLSNMFNCIDTASVYSRGLALYFPFEKNDTIDGVPTKSYTFENRVPGATDELRVIANSQASAVFAAPIKKAPEESRLLASPIASERKVVVKLKGDNIAPRDIEGTTLNLTVADVRDLNGNASQPIRWTAYVRRNPLLWTRDSVSLTKLYGEELVFDVDVINKSGNVEYYSVENLPQWLTLVESNAADEVAPSSSRTLRFRVDPYVRVGLYDVTIGLQGNFEILEPLRIQLKVSGEKPDWSFDPTAYEHQMNVIGQVRIDGILMENTESIVAAFIGGKCRGLASPEKVRGAAYVTLSIYGNGYRNQDADKPVTFAIYDASNGMTYVDVDLTLTDGTPAQVLFKHDELIGDFDQPAIWTKSGKVEQSLSIHENWNWIGLGVQPEDDSPQSVFSSYDGWSLMMKDQGSQVAWSNGTEWDGPLSVTAGTMYKLRVTSLPTSPKLPSQLAVTGRQVTLSTTPVELHDEWNWIAYTPLYSMTIDEALAGANPQRGDRVKSQSGIAIYGNTGWEGNLKSLESGHGYMYYNSSGVRKSFVYPSPSASSQARMRAMAYAGDQPTLFTPVDRHHYPDNMTMVIQLTDGEAVVDSAEVAAFVNGECRGATRSYNGLYYLIISGEGSSVPMQLYTYLEDRMVLIDDSQYFTSDDNVGDPWSPYVIDLQHLPDAIGSISTDEDAADDAWYTLQGFRLGGRPESPGIYIHRGQKVAVGADADNNP